MGILRTSLFSLPSIFLLYLIIHFLFLSSFYFYFFIISFHHFSWSSFILYFIFLFSSCSLFVSCVNHLFFYYSSPILLVLFRSFPFRFFYLIVSSSCSSPPPIPPYRLTPLAADTERHLKTVLSSQPSVLWHDEQERMLKATQMYLQLVQLVVSALKSCCQTRLPKLHSLISQQSHHTPQCTIFAPIHPPFH